MTSGESLGELQRKAAFWKRCFDSWIAFLLFLSLSCLAASIWLKFDPGVLGLVDCSKLDPKWLSECAKHQSFAQCESNLGDLRGVSCR